MLRRTTCFFKQHGHGELNDIQRQVSLKLFQEFRNANPQLIAPALQFSFTTEDPDPDLQDNRLASKIGGMPFHPKSHEWSKKKMGNLKLLAQFNLTKDLSPHQRIALSLPAVGGMLQFFINPSDSYGADFEDCGRDGPETFRVVYWNNQVLKYHSDESKLTDLTDLHPPIDESTDADFPFPKHMLPRFVEFEKELSYDFGGSTEQMRLLFKQFLAQNIHSHTKSVGNVRDKLYASGLTEEDFDKLFDAFQANEKGFNGRDPNSGSKLGGHPACIEGDWRKQFGEKEFLDFDKVPQLLLQLECEDGSGGGGDPILCGFYVESKEDLIVGKLNKCFYAWQSL